MFINVKMPTIVDILTLISMIHFMLSQMEHEKTFITAGPICVGCDTPFTLRHFLLECGNFSQVRNNCSHVDNMKQLFQDIHINSIMTILKEINVFNKICYCVCSCNNRLLLF